MGDGDITLSSSTGADVYLSGSPTAPTVYVNVAGTWKQASAVYVNVAGTWKEASALGINVAGTWKQA